MINKKELVVFICEDNETAEKIMGFLESKMVTFASIYPIEKRKEIIKKLEECE